jgi:hypothetical protein
MQQRPTSPRAVEAPYEIGLPRAIPVELAPLQTTGFELPAGQSSNDEFARRFPDGGDY